jgi:hypothetical protein
MKSHSVGWDPYKCNFNFPKLMSNCIFSSSFVWYSQFASLLFPIIYSNMCAVVNWRKWKASIQFFIPHLSENCVPCCDPIQKRKLRSGWKGVLHCSMCTCTFKICSLLFSCLFGHYVHSLQMEICYCWLNCITDITDSFYFFLYLLNIHHF